VFASLASAGGRPYWPDKVLNHRVRPAAVVLGITKQIGWHTFRRTYASLLKSSGADVKVVQDSLRHANARITMELYAQALTQDKRTCPNQGGSDDLAEEHPASSGGVMPHSHRHQI